MGSVGLILSEEAYYGFRLAGLNRCFLVADQSSVRRAINTLSLDKGVSLVIIEKKLNNVLTKEEQQELADSEQPQFFVLDTSANQSYSEEITQLIKRLGIAVNE